MFSACKLWATAKMIRVVRVARIAKWSEGRRVKSRGVSRNPLWTATKVWRERAKGDSEFRSLAGFTGITLPLSQNKKKNVAGGSQPPRHPSRTSNSRRAHNPQGHTLPPRLPEVPDRKETRQSVCSDPLRYRDICKCACDYV